MEMPPRKSNLEIAQMHRGLTIVLTMDGGDRKITGLVRKYKGRAGAARACNGSPAFGQRVGEELVYLGNDEHDQYLNKDTHYEPLKRHLPF